MRAAAAAPFAGRGPAWRRSGWRSAPAGWLGFGYFLAGFLVARRRLPGRTGFRLGAPPGRDRRPAASRLLSGLRLRGSRGCSGAPAPGACLPWRSASACPNGCAGHILTGFPWNALGMALGGTLVSAQAASLVGLDGLTLIAIALFAAPATLADQTGRGLVWRPTLVALGAGVLLAAFGAARLAQTPPAPVSHAVRADHAAGPASRREIQARKQGRHPRPLSRPVRVASIPTKAYRSPT